MTVEDSLARLTAGLAEDEAIARGAWKEGALHGDQWTVRKLAGGLFDGGTYVCDVQSPPHGDDISQTRDGETGHIERHDPARVLRQVEAIRRVIDIEIGRLRGFDDEYGDRCSRDDIAAGKCMSEGKLIHSEILTALASIYPDPTEEFDGRAGGTT